MNMNYQTDDTILATCVTSVCDISHEFFSAISWLKNAN
jgi:hypothetical protein